MNLLHLESPVKQAKKALVCYLPQSCTLPLNHPNFIGHSNFQECRVLVRTLNQQGYHCDLANWNEDARHLINANYDVAFVMRHQIEYAKQLVKPNGKVIFYSAHCHWQFHNLAEQNRITQLEKRKKITLSPRRQLNQIMNEDQVDEIWYLGNDFHKNTYQHLNVPKYRLNISTIKTGHYPKSTITEESTKQFLWFGSAGAVHKGLDWLLEIFSRNPQWHLNVCGLVEMEKDFCELYYKELYETPNIHFHGWTLPNTEKFKQLCEQSAFIISPSAAEGGGGATLQCMGMGLIPIVTSSNAVDVTNSGYMPQQNTLESLESLLFKIKNTRQTELMNKMHAATEQAREKHTLNAYQNSVLERVSRL